MEWFEMWKVEPPKDGTPIFVQFDDYGFGLVYWNDNLIDHCTGEPGTWQSDEDGESYHGTCFEYWCIANLPPNFKKFKDRKE